MLIGVVILVQSLIYSYIGGVTRRNERGEKSPLFYFFFGASGVSVHILKSSSKANPFAQYMHSWVAA